MINYLELVSNVEEGIESPFKAMAILKELEKDIKECIDQVKPILIDEASKYEKSFELEGLKVEKRNGKKNYDFKGISEWKEAEANKKKVEETYRELFSLYEKGKLVADVETGELPQLPEVTYSSEVVVVKNLGESLIH